MSKEEIIKILSKIKDTVGENNYKLALAITGHKTGKIKEIIMCSKDGELLLEYIEQLEQENKQLKDNWNMLKEHLKNRYDNGTESISYREVFIEIKEMMKEIEQGSDSNEIF